MSKTASGLSPATLRTAVAKAKSVPELKQIVDYAQTAVEACKRTKQDVETTREFADAAFDGIVKAGRLLADLKRTPPQKAALKSPAADAGDSPYAQALEAAELKERTAQTWQQIGRLSDKSLAKYRASVPVTEWPAISRALRLARDAKSKTGSDDKAKRTIAAMEQKRSADLRIGDFRLVLADVPDGSVAAIITDPPYPKAHLHLFGELAAFADRVLSPDGVLAVMSGQTHLPSVFAEMGGHRPYRWTVAYLTSGPGYASHARRIQSSWKPVLVYGGGESRFSDVISSEAPDKRLHEWGQDLGGFTALVERLTEPASLVCDPFLGGGTTALASLSLGRQFIGCDIDPAAVKATKARIA